VALHQSADYAGAEAALREALRLAPDFADAHHNLGLALRERGDIEGAIVELRAALGLRPNADTLSALGDALRDAGEPDAALVQYDAALHAAPRHGDAELNRALTLLMAGDWARGWDAYEHRFTASRLRPREFGLPQWQGGHGAGKTGAKTILVFGEQGLGDEIMFASCIPDLLASEGRCVIECNERLQKLFARSFGMPTHGGEKSDGVEWVRTHPELGWQIPVGGLPRLFRRDATAFSRAAPAYLRGDPARTSEWRRRFAGIAGNTGTRRVVGLAWHGGIQRTRGALRSIALPELAPLAALPGVSFVSLQHGDVSAEIERCREEHEMQVAVWDGAGDDIDELAAMIAALDLVITIDNTTAHVAGGLGVPLWIMLPRGAEWRYGYDETRMPWYARARLFRRHSGQRDWSDVVARIAAELAAGAV
jgi:hypothetical protein